MNGYLTTVQAGKRLGVNASRVRQLVLAGTLNYEKIGRDLLIHERDVEALIRRRRATPKKSGAPFKFA